MRCVARSTVDVIPCNHFTTVRSAKFPQRLDDFLGGKEGGVFKCLLIHLL